MKIKFKLKELKPNSAGEPDRGEGSRYENVGLEEKENIIGGLGDKKPDSDFNPAQLALGVKRELEHTNNRALAKEIAKDHLTEDPLYYTHLSSAGIKEYLELREEDKKAAVMLSQLIKNIEEQKNKIWVFFDTETTGLEPSSAQLIELAAIAVNPDFSGGEARVLSQFHKKAALTPETLKQIEAPFTPDPKNSFKKSVKDLLQMTQYYSGKGEEADEATVLASFVAYIKSLESQGEVILIAHNASFDRKFISVRSSLYGIEKLNNKTIDTLELVYDFFYPLLVVADKNNLMSKMRTPKGMPSFTLGKLTAALEISNKDWHSALADVNSLIQVTQKMISFIKSQPDIDVRKGYEKSVKLRRGRAAWTKQKKK